MPMKIRATLAQIARRLTVKWGAQNAYGYNPAFDIVVEAGLGRAVRVRGMDAGQSSAACKFHRAQGRPGRG
jgi:hypothetical protein